jgi:hypothetical protein
MAKEPPKEKTLWHQSGVAPTGDPFVQLILDEEIIAQMSPEAARDHARQITEAAEAAEQDAFIMDFMQRQIGLDINRAGQVLVDLRNYRAERTGKSQGPRGPRDWVMPPEDKRPSYGEFWKKDPNKDA